MANGEGASSGGLRVLAADEDEAGLERTCSVLRALGHEVTASAVDLAEATEAIAREDPDVSVVLVHDDDEHALDLIEQIHAFSRGPVIALLEREHPGFLRRAAERGVAAYTRDLDEHALQGAIDVAVRRHAEHARLETKVDQLETALERRALIERAKGILMERHGLDERDAFELLRAHARSRSRSVVDVAAAVADGHPLLPAGVRRSGE